MKAWRKVGFVALLLIVAVVFWLRWKEGGPRRLALHPISQLGAAVRTGNSPDLLKAICTPATIQGRTAPEQAQFLTEALAGGISSPSRSVYYPSDHLFSAPCVVRHRAQAGNLSQMNTVLN